MLTKNFVVLKSSIHMTESNCKDVHDEKDDVAKQVQGCNTGCGEAFRSRKWKEKNITKRKLIFYTNSCDLSTGTSHKVFWDPGC